MGDEMDPLAVLKKVVPTELLKEIYGDLAKPGATQVGKALGTVCGLGNTLLWPITLLNEKARVALDKNMEKYREQLEGVPAEEVSEVPPEIGVPIAEKFGYVTNEELGDLYVNLLAKASTFKTANVAHPAFVNVINNLSPDEAMLLKELKDVRGLAFVEARLVKKDNSNEWIPVKNLLTGLERVIKLSFPENIESYMSNFEGLGLFQIRRDIFIVHPELYDELREFYRPFFETIEYDKEIYEPNFNNGKIEITPFGRLFIDACCK